VREAFDPADKELKEFNEAIVWLVREIHLETGLSHGEVFVAIYYLATYGHFEGFDRTDAGPYGGLDLRHLALTFHTLDKDGTTARLWRGLYRNWSIIRTLCEGCLEARRPTSEALPANMSLAKSPAPAKLPDHQGGSPPDGPIARGQFAWGGQSTEDLTPLQLALLEALWDAEKGQPLPAVSLAEVVRHIYGDDAGPRTREVQKKLHELRRRTQKELVASKLKLLIDANGQTGFWRLTPL
jgi:hypothetical protein